MSSTSHLKRYPAPQAWLIERKVCRHIQKPNPGAHSQKECMPISLLLKQLGLAKTNKEVKHILKTHQVLVDGRRVKDHRIGVGVMDVLSIPHIKLDVRVVLDSQHRLTTVPTKLTGKKPAQVKGKRQIAPDKFQFSLSGGRSIVLDNQKYAKGDVLVLELPKQKVVEHVALKKGATVFLTGGRHCGELGVVEDVLKETVWYKIGNNSHETSKEYAFVVFDTLAKELKQ